VWHFGKLIANTDMHEGNLSFRPGLALAPAYDMLPMLYAPEHGELPPREFTPPAPTSENLREFGRARALAEQYWSACARDSRIGDEFRGIAATNHRALEALPRMGAFHTV
jgi:hypothetical protein